MIDVLYTNGVIAVKEKSLLGDRLPRLCELSAEDAFRALIESGFGSGSEAVSPSESELLCAAEEAALDAFIREYAPSKAIQSYLLAPRDFHNAKALVKAEKLGASSDGMLAPEGMVKISDISAAVKEGNFEKLGSELAGAVKEALAGENLTGAEVGAIFEEALFSHLAAAVKQSLVLKKLLAGRADRMNILTALRSTEREHAEKLYLPGGKLNSKKLAAIFEPDREKAAQTLDKTPYEAFYKNCLEAKENGLPFTGAERELESYEAEYFAARRFELERKEPFLYYVFRRRAEIANVRILLVCLNAGLKEQDVKKRLRAI